MLYIVPWQPPGGADNLSQPMQPMLDDVFAPVDRTEFQRELKYREESAQRSYALALREIGIDDEFVEPLAVFRSVSQITAAKPIKTAIVGTVKVEIGIVDRLVVVVTVSSSCRNSMNEAQRANLNAANHLSANFVCELRDFIMDLFHTAVRFFQEGGFFMYPIAVVLVFGVAISIERWVFLTCGAKLESQGVR